MPRRPAARSSADAIIGTIREVTKLRGEVAFRGPGELPNDGKVIDDTRKFDYRADRLLPQRAVGATMAIGRVD